jgi:hypothetical protein
MMWCQDCEISPFLESVCFHEMPRDDVTINNWALLPCSKERIW